MKTLTNMKRCSLLGLCLLVIFEIGCGSSSGSSSPRPDPSAPRTDRCHYIKVREPSLVPFRDPETYLWGYRDGAGTVRIAPAFTFADDQWNEGFAWVDTERCSRSAHPDWRCCLEVSGQDDCGTFIRSDGSRLFSFHAHEVAAIYNDMWDFVPPRFDHGLAFVRFPDGLVRGITTNGTPLPLHDRYGGFVTIDHADYITYRGDWALVELTNGCLGVLGPDHDFAVGPSDDTEMVLAAWRRGPAVDPFP